MSEKKKSYKVDVTGIVTLGLGLLAGCALVALGDPALAQIVIATALGGAVLPSAYRAHHEDAPASSSNAADATKPEAGA